VVDLHVTPVLAQILGDQAAMAMMRLVLAAEQAAALEARWRQLSFRELHRSMIMWAKRIAP